MKSYIVRFELTHDKKPVTPGQSIELTQDQAAPLIRLGVIAEESEAYIPNEPDLPDAETVFEQAFDAGLIQRSGNWFSYNGQNLGNGRANALAAFITQGLAHIIHPQIQS